MRVATSPVSRACPDKRPRHSFSAALQPPRFSSKVGLMIPAETDVAAGLPDLPVEASDADAIGMLEDEISRLADALSNKFEELTVIHQLSDRLKLDEDFAPICDSVLDELRQCLDVDLIALELAPDESLRFPGRCYWSGAEEHAQQLQRVAAHATEMARRQRADTSRELPVTIWNHPTQQAPAPVRTVVVPVQRQETRLGQMIAIRDLASPEFGTAEADMIKSIAIMLGAHLINQRQYLEMQQMFEGTLRSLVSALDAKDAYTSGHSSRVAELAAELAERLGFDANSIRRIHMAGILHDIGKIGISDAVLQKADQLDEQEFEQIKQHPVLGYEILRGFRPFQSILPAVKHHHEAWDGSGYPDGLVGDQIPRDAQILAVADAFDAMTSDRPYRDGLPLERVTNIFHRGRGTQWAADVVDVLLACPEMMRVCSNRNKRLAT